MLDEMLMTGTFELLRDGAIGEQPRRYMQLRERARAHHAEATNELFRPHGRFPALIRVARAPLTSEDARRGGLAGDGFQGSPVCDVDGMRGAPAFLDEYADKLSRIDSLARLTSRGKDQLAGRERLLAAAIEDPAAR